MGKKEVLMLLCIFFILAAGAANAAQIYGTIYDLGLNEAKDVLVEINTKPKQQYVAKNGTYSFSVPLGDYVLSAKRYSEAILVSTDEENVSIKSEGDYVLDLILFPSLEEEEQLLSESDIDIETGLVPEETNPLAVAAVLIAIVALFLILRMRGKIIGIRRKEIEKEEAGYDEIKKVVDFIKKEGGRTTQKDIRKHFPQSEAKISLILTELEDREVIRKIKKGRGNVIILN
ncbi:hypothetical protein JW707_04310 [Candidatus Woesearchaeota archaeon]|nr:hypothetical protein [Candidatus Woesearchaeota archaeon]